MHTEGIWTLVVIVGPILLAIGLLWSMLHNRGSKADMKRTEDATRRNYDAENARDRRREAS